MFVALSKILDLGVAPLTWALALLVLAGALRRRGRWPLLLGTAALAVLCLFSIAPVAERLVRLGEAGAASTWRPDVTYDAAVVLGGMVDGAASRASGAVELTSAADRVTRSFELWRSGRVRLLILTGGNVVSLPDEPPEAERLAALLRGWGVPAEAIVIEGRSRNTRENALETARVVSELDLTELVLVTSALHMPRALGCFRAVGLHPDALPVDRRGSDGVNESWLPRAETLSESTDVLRELTGRAVYRLAGYTR